MGRGAMDSTMRISCKIVLSAVFLLQFCSQDNKSNKKWLNFSPVQKEEYVSDSIKIIKLLKISLKNHQDFFFSKEYFELTQVIIDTIIYSPDFKKIVVFIVTKNPTYRHRIPDKRSEWYYNAHCYLGFRSNDFVSLYSTGPSFSNSVDRKKLVKLARSEYFTIYAKLKDANGNYRYKYNIGDIRFWNCPIWMEAERKMKK